VPDLEGEQIGPYAIGRMLGQGGMGVVYEAVDTRPTSCRFQHTVALKILAADLDAPEQLVREAQLLAALEHKHIVPVYEVGEYEGIVYFTMKRIDGGPLTTPAPSPKRAAEIALEIAEAVALAHRHGILHRDLKPANVLVDREGRTFVTDFGLAAREGPGDALAPGGTPAYMAPEVWRGEPHTSTAVDVWGAGAILYELLAGRPPFEAATLTELKRRVLTEAPPALKGVPADLAAVCLRCLEKDPSRRYATAVGLSADIARFLAGEPVLARPLGFGARGLRRAARHPVITALSALLVAAALYAAVIALSLGRAQQAALRAADFAARRTADVTALKFERYTAAVEAAGRDPLVARAAADPASPQASEVCARLLAARDGPTAGPFATWFLLDGDGRMIGHAPNTDRPIVGRSFKFRDYFRGVEELERQGRRDAYVSRVFRSESDDHFEIAISFAVHDDAGRWIGLLAASLPTGSALGSIEFDDPDDERLTAALLAPRGLERGESETNPEPIFIMHRALSRGEALVARADDVLSTDAGGGSLVRLVPVRGTPFSVLVRVAFDDPLTSSAPPGRR
jgi:serine/threonine-protein kinase